MVLVSSLHHESLPVVVLQGFFLRGVQVQIGVEKPLTHVVARCVLNLLFVDFLPLIGADLAVDHGLVLAVVHQKLGHGNLLLH